jgi:hypothetical protein
MLGLPSLRETGRLGITDVERIRGAATRLHQLDDRHGGAQLGHVAATYVEHAERTMRHCTYGSLVQSSLLQTLGELTASTGWFAFDAGRHGKARQWWDTGLRYALLARDAQLQARIWSYMARQACDLGHGGWPPATSAGFFRKSWRAFHSPSPFAPPKDAG